MKYRKERIEEEQDKLNQKRMLLRVIEETIQSRCQINYVQDALKFILNKCKSVHLAILFIVKIARL